MKQLLFSLIYITVGAFSGFDSVNAETEHVQSVAGPNGFEDEYWTLKCSKDDFSDEKSCVITVQTKESSFGYYNLYFMVFPNGAVIADINLSNDTHPGTTKFIRVDNNKTIEIKASERFFLAGSNSKSASHSDLLTQLQNGKEVRIRWYKWPYENRNHDETFSLVGFSEAISTALSYLSGNLKFSLEDAISQINRHGTLMGTNYSQLKACGKKSQADFLISKTEKILAQNSELLINFKSSFEAIKSMDPYGIFEGDMDCGTAETEINSSIHKIEEVISNLE